MTSLSILQNRMKRSPESYTDDFQRHLSHFVASLSLQTNSTATSKESSKQLAKLAGFLAAVSPCYAKDGGAKVPELIINFLNENGGSISPDLRLKLFQALILLRVRDLLPADTLIQFSFSMFKIKDKPFRQALYSYIIKDVRIVNKKKTNVELNKKLQNLVFQMLSDDEKTAGSPAAAKRALSVVIELYKRRVWVDTRAVNVVAEAVFSRIARNAVLAARFFLGIDDEIDELLAAEEDDVDEDEQYQFGSGKGEKDKRQKLRSSLQQPKVQKQTKSKMRKRNKTIKQLKKIENGSEHKAVSLKTGEMKRKYAPRFPAIDLIHDPQTFAERLLKLIKTSTERFEVRVIQLNLLSRIVGHHKLLLFPLYSFCMKYLQPHQSYVTQILACTIQGCHDLVPPEELEPILHHLANNFITDRTGPEVTAIGLNTVRQLLIRVPLLTNTESVQTLIRELVGLRKSGRRDRSVMIAARSLLLEIRRINPKTLQRKDRGRDGSMNASELKPLEYGEQKVSEGVDGIELLEQWLSKHPSENEDEDEEEEEGSLNNELQMVEEDEGEEDELDAEGLLEEDDQNDDQEGDMDQNGEDEEDGKKRKRLDVTRILTDEDFKHIRQLKKLEAEGKLGSNQRKNKMGKPSVKQGKFMGHVVMPLHEDKETKDEGSDENNVSLPSEEEEEDEEDQGVYDPSIVNPFSLEGLQKKKRREIQEKLQAMKEQQDFKKEQKSTRTVNNTEKQKRTKDFHMVQKSTSVRKKQKLSIREQQAGVKKHMKALQKKSKLLTKVRRKG